MGNLRGDMTTFGVVLRVLRVNHHGLLLVDWVASVLQHFLEPLENVRPSHVAWCTLCEDCLCAYKFDGMLLACLPV